MLTTKFTEQNPKQAALIQAQAAKVEKLQKLANRSPGASGLLADLKTQRDILMVLSRVR
jgi:hypothetical protein